MRTRLIRPAPPGGAATATGRYIVIRGGNELLPGNTPGIKRLDGILSETTTTRDPGTQATASLTVGGGEVTAATVTNSGSVYASATAVISGDGSGATATVAVNTTTGVVTSITITDGGSEYTTASIAITAPNGEPAGLPWEDGLGYADLINLSTGAQSRVLVVNDDRSQVHTALAEGRRVSVPAVTNISVTSPTGTVNCYVPALV